MVLRQLNTMNDGEIVKEGHLKRLKTHKKRYFVLRSSPRKGKSRLEYYESEKKYRQNSSPKRVIYLANCLNIARKEDSKHKLVFVLFTHEDRFGLVADTEDGLNSWLKCLKIEQRKDEILNSSASTWHVSVKPRGLGTSKNLAGQYDLQLTGDSLKLVIKDTRDVAMELRLVNIRRCGHTDCFFFMELGRSAVTGAGEMWIQVDDQVIAQNMHEAILAAMQSISDIPPKARRRCASEGRRGKGRPRPVSALLYPASRVRADTEPSSPPSSYRVGLASSTKNLSLNESPKNKPSPGLNRFLPRRKSKDVSSVDSLNSNQEETNSDFSEKVLVKPYSSSRPSSEEKDAQPVYVNFGAESIEDTLSSEDYMKMALDRRHSCDSYLDMDMSKAKAMKAARDQDSQETTKSTQIAHEGGYMDMTSLRQQAEKHVTPKLQNSGIRSDFVRQKKTSSPRLLRANESPLPNKPDIREFVSLKKSPSSSRRNLSQDYITMSPVGVRKEQTPIYMNFVPPGQKLSRNSSSSELISNDKEHPVYVNFTPGENHEKAGRRVEPHNPKKCPEISVDSSPDEEMHCYVNFSPYRKRDQISVPNFRKHSLESILTEPSREYVNVDLSGIAKSKSAVDMPEYVNFTPGKLFENGKRDSDGSSGEMDSNVQQEVDYVNYSPGKLEVKNSKWRRSPRYGRRESEPALSRPCTRDFRSVSHSAKENEDSTELHYIVLDLSKNEKEGSDSPSRRRTRPPKIDLSSCSRAAPGPKSAPLVSPYAEVDFTKSHGIRQARQEMRVPANTAV